MLFVYVFVVMPNCHDFDVYALIVNFCVFVFSGKVVAVSSCILDIKFVFFFLNISGIMSGEQVHGDRILDQLGKAFQYASQYGDDGGSFLINSKLFFHCENKFFSPS